MKKYFMKDTEDELQFGDMIEVDFTEDMPDGHVTHHHLDCKFIPDLVPMLVENDIIDVVSDEEEDKENAPIDFTEGCPKQELDDKMKSLEDTIKSLQKTIAALQKTLQTLVA